MVSYSCGMSASRRLRSHMINTKVTRGGHAEVARVWSDGSGRRGEPTMEPAARQLSDQDDRGDPARPDASVPRPATSVDPAAPPAPPATAAPAPTVSARTTMRDRLRRLSLDPV